MFAVATSALFIVPQIALAACCICTNPQVSGGKFCVSGVSGSCEDLTNSTNPDIKASSCTKDASANPCKKQPSGLCLNEPTTETNFSLSSVSGYKAPSGSATQGPATLDTFKLNIAVPGLTFYAPYKDNNELIIPMLAQYIAAMQKLLIGIGIIAAAIMFTYGGWLYVVSGTGLKVKEGKQIIIDTTIGIVIILGSVTILANINPNTASLGALHLTFVNPSQFIPVTASQYQSAASLLGLDGNMPSAGEMLTAAKEKAKQKGIDPCIAWAILNAESGGRLIVGHDENWYAGTGNVIPQSRVDFMRSRKYYSGKEFPAEVPIVPGNCKNAQVQCHAVAGYKLSSSNAIIMNDDTPQFGQPPDFGIDWRYSHGFGAGLTVFPHYPKCPNGWRGLTLNGKCYSVAELVTKDGQFEAMFSMPAFWKDGKVGGTPINDPMSVFKSWAGCQDKPGAKNPCSKVQKLLDIKQKYFETCKNSSN